MALYKKKTETDLAWNSIRRRITTELDLQLKDWREAELNKLIGGAWAKYAKSLGHGELIELEAKYENWIDQALANSVAS